MKKSRLIKGRLVLVKNLSHIRSLDMLSFIMQN
jgi:hypothetical protein